MGGIQHRVDNILQCCFAVRTPLIMIIVILSQLLSPGMTEAQVTLHAVLVGDTLKREDGDESKDIALDMIANLRDFEVLLLSNSPINQLKIYECKDDAYAKLTIFKKLDEMAVQENDAILFYFCGHGFYDNSGQLEKGRIGTLFRPPTDEYRNLWLSEIHEHVRAKQPRFFVSLVDCCSIQPSKRTARRAGAPGQRPLEFSNLFNALFFQNQGEISINSSAPGEYAVSSGQGKGNGSLFTRSFMKSVPGSNHAITWQQLIKRTRTEVQEEFARLKEKYETDATLLGGETIGPQVSQTVWAIKDGQIWFQP